MRNELIAHTNILSDGSETMDLFWIREDHGEPKCFCFVPSDREQDAFIDQILKTISVIDDEVIAVTWSSDLAGSDARKPICLK